LVGGFLAEGFSAAQPAIVIATVEHRLGILNCLRSSGHDPEALEAAGQLVFLDANETLAAFMVDGMPDATKFRAAIVPVIDAVASRVLDTQVRAYGEMVDVLWKAGRTVAATKLEMLWNDLARDRRFALLCGYAMGNFYKDAAVEDICSHHSHVFSPSGEAAILQ
jgi:hypothetical protein